MPDDVTVLDLYDPEVSPDPRRTSVYTCTVTASTAAPICGMTKLAEVCAPPGLGGSAMEFVVKVRSGSS